jgi:hypothetical protein
MFNACFGSKLAEPFVNKISQVSRRSASARPLCRCLGVSTTFMQVSMSKAVAIALSTSWTVGHTKHADLVRQEMRGRIDRDVSDIGENARDKIGTAAPRHL